MSPNLTIKHAVVTGGSRGIGRAVAAKLARDGYEVMIVARDQGAISGACAEIGAQTGRRTLGCAADLSEAGAAEVVKAAVLRAFGGLHVLVNNAGATKRGAWQEMSEEDWRAGFALKFFGAERLSRALWPMLRESRGAIVNVIGVGGRTPSADFTIGSSVNAACMALTKALADQGITDGVRVNAVNPGMIATGRLGRWIAALAQAEGITLDEAEKRLPKSMGIARVGQPEEIAAAVAFLAGEEAGYCQGTIMDVDGGRTRVIAHPCLRPAIYAVGKMGVPARAACRA